MSFPFIASKIARFMKTANTKDFGRRSAGSKARGGDAHTRKKFTFPRIRARRVTSWWRRYACEWRHDAASGVTIITIIIKWPRRGRRAAEWSGGPAHDDESRPTYKLPLLLASLRRRKPPQVVRRVHSRSAFEERMGNTRRVHARGGEEIGNLSDSPRN